MLRARDPKQLIDEIYGKLGRKKAPRPAGD